jgi:hypothetical protein
MLRGLGGDVAAGRRMMNDDWKIGTAVAAFGAMKAQDKPGADSH